MRGLSLFILFVSVPLLEIYLLIEIGGVIGAGWTLFAIVATALIGASLVRLQGLGVFQRLQGTAARGELPALELLEGAGLLFSGLLLLTPGFFTDALGFLLLVPPLRRALVLRLLRQVIVAPGVATAGEVHVQRIHRSHGRTHTIDGDYDRVDD